MWEGQEPPLRSASQDTWALGRPLSAVARLRGIRRFGDHGETWRQRRQEEGSMQPRLRVSILVSLICLLFIGGARAQTAPAPIKISETVVVTANGKEEPVSQVGASITVLTREQIEQRHALSTIDLLNTVPAVTATRTGGIGGLTSLF